MRERSGSLADRSGFDAVILAGGRSSRLGGADKAAVDIGGVSLLERVLAASAAADRTICVGPVRSTSRSVVWTREEPAGAGPVAALGAGLVQVEAPVVVLLAVDLPFVTAAVVRDLVSVSADAEAALMADADDVPQPLIGAYATHPLRERLADLGDLTGVSMRLVIAGISYSLLHEPGVTMDCDTWQDVEAARQAEGT